MPIMQATNLKQSNPADCLPVYNNLSSTWHNGCIPSHTLYNAFSVCRTLDENMHKIKNANSSQYRTHWASRGLHIFQLTQQHFPPFLSVPCFFPAIFTPRFFVIVVPSKLLPVASVPLDPRVNPWGGRGGRSGGKRKVKELGEWPLERRRCLEHMPWKMFHNHSPAYSHMLRQGAYVRTHRE